MIFKKVNAQKLFGSIDFLFKNLLTILSGVKVDIKKGKRCKPKKNNGLDFVMQNVASKLCSHKSIYRMDRKKTPKILKKQGVSFLQKSTFYNNISNLNMNSVWKVNKHFLKPKLEANGKVVVVLDGTLNVLEGKKYECRKKGYVRTNRKGEAVTDFCHQLFFTSLLETKKVVYGLRPPKNYNSFTIPNSENKKFSGLNFTSSVTECMVKKTYKMLKKPILWLFDRGFNNHKFWAKLFLQNDDL